MVAVIFNQSQLDTGFIVLRWHLERNLPGALRSAFIAPQSQKDNTFNIACHARLDGKPENQAIRLTDPQSQAKLLCLGFLTPRRPHRRFLGKSSIKADGHLLDEKYEMMTVVHDRQPGVHA